MGSAQSALLVITEKTERLNTTKRQDGKMHFKKYATIVSVFCLTFVLWAALLPPLTVSAAAPYIQAETAILMDVDTGQILWEKGMHQKMYPASLTKIMTALLALEESDPQEVVTMSRQAVALPYGYSHISLTDGEQITMLQALYATLLPSANDAANGIAEHVSGSIEAFAEKMNLRAAELGAMNTHFVNPSGMPDDDHYTTAYDLALITMEALKQPLFTQIWGTVQYTMDPTNKQDDERYLWNQTRLLIKNNRYYYQYCTGGKLGYTQESKHTFIAVAEKDGRRLLCVLMKNKLMADNFLEAQTLFEYGFNSFTPHTITADQIEKPQSVPIYRQGKEVGQMFFEARPITLLLTDGVLPHEVTAVYNLPDRVEYGKQPVATVTYTLPAHVEGQYSTVGEQHLLVTGQEFFIKQEDNEQKESSLPKTSYSQAEIDTPIWAMIIMVLCFGISSIMMSLRLQTARTVRSHRQLSSGE